MHCQSKCADWRSRRLNISSGACRDADNPASRSCQSKCTGWTKEFTAVSMRHALLPKTSPSVPLIQLLIQRHPPSCDDVCAVPAQPAERRGLAVRARHRHLPRDGEVLVEQGRPNVRHGSSAPARRVHMRNPSLALAPRQGVREDQRGAALPLARSPLRRSSSRECGRSRPTNDRGRWSIPNFEPQTLNLNPA